MARNPTDTMENSQQMKAFENTQKNFIAFGVAPNLATQAYPFNLNVLIAFLTLDLTIISMLVYAINEAKTFSEYTQSIYFCTLIILITFSLVTMTLKVETLYEYIKAMGATINIS